MIRCLLLALLLAGSPRASGAVFERPVTAAELEQALAPATAALADAQSLQGRFRQTKTLNGLPRPLVSEGDFLYARTLGISWRSQTPFSSELLITPDALVQREGASEQRVEAAAQPAVRAIAQVFFAVFTLDFETLTTLFRPYAERGEGDDWTLGLEPLQPLGAIETIEITGDTRVTRVVLSERNGDRTRIELSDTRISTAALTDAERARFQAR